MNKKVLIVEDQFVEANDIQLTLEKAGYKVSGIARSVKIAKEMIKRERPGIVLLDIFLKGDLTGVDLAKFLREEDIAFVYLSANSNEDVLAAAKTTEPYGFIVKPFRERDLLVTLEIAEYRHERSRESCLRRESTLRGSLSKIISREEAWETKLLGVVTALQPYIPFDYFTAGFNHLDRLSGVAFSFLRIGYDEYQKIGTGELRNITGLESKDLAILAGRTDYGGNAAIFNDNVFQRECAKPSLLRQFSETFEMRSYLYFPLKLRNGQDYIFGIYSRKTDSYDADHIRLLEQLKEHLTAIVETGLDNRRDRKVANAGVKGAPVNDDHKTGDPGFQGIIGKNHLLLNVFDMIAQVAPSNSSVLILGESGTGKERIADCIHNLSTRKGRPFVKVNCAALPSTLIESELFGHEKGAFTGALEKRIGKFETADTGTIFLDEIGDMPLDMQVKLLRVLQERYIERIGAKDLTKVDVRIIAATHHNLEKEVAIGRFRLDLYYRLNVFPIELPPLRDRSEDIPALVDHFISFYNQKTGKKITGVSERVLKNMLAYSWPGNIRELENLVERGVLLAKGSIIDDIAFTASQRSAIEEAPRDSRIKTISENERDYIVDILKKCHGRVWGADGAAQLLKVPPSTLRSKMLKLHIRKEDYRL